MDKRISSLIDNIEKVIIGKREVITQAVTALLAEGHVLIEDVPGVGKTQLAAALSRSVDGAFSRVQLTPDVMPSDITGFSMINRQTGELEYKEGAAFCNFLLADEINRASPKAQSSLLEIMEERQVSIDGKTHALPRPFMVLATQNPVETYGTYHLPEAQMDRFAMKISMGYPDKSEEMRILERNEFENPVSSLTPVLTTDDIAQIQDEVKTVRAADNVKNYIVAISDSTRNSENIKLGVSPRGSIALYKAAKALAFINERDYITPDDVRECAVAVLAHRIMLSPKGRAVLETPEAAIEKAVAETIVPTE
ncbi:MAG: MoxR family ATPase [Oscillospiraceae bacterium]|nr:MoxR family ATPase [Oscillospiraceae bacterium]